MPSMQVGQNRGTENRPGQALLSVSEERMQLHKLGEALSPVLLKVWQSLPRGIFEQEWRNDPEVPEGNMQALAKASRATYRQPGPGEVLTP